MKAYNWKLVFHNTLLYASYVNNIIPQEEGGKKKTAKKQMEAGINVSMLDWLYHSPILLFQFLLLWLCETILKSCASLPIPLISSILPTILELHMNLFDVSTTFSSFACFALLTFCCFCTSFWWPWQVSRFASGGGLESQENKNISLPSSFL